MFPYLASSCNDLFIHFKKLFMRKALIVCCLFATAIFFVPISSLSSNSYSKQRQLTIPRNVLVTAEKWACDHGVLPETPYPDRVWAYYTQMGKTAWEVHWFWIKSGVSDDVRLLISKNGTIISETW